MKANRQPKSRADLSTLGTALQPKPIPRMEEVERKIDELMATLEPFQQQILVHKLKRRYE